MNPILGAKDDPSDFEGRHGRVRQELEAQQGQSQGHLQLVHGKLLPNAIPAEKQSSSASSIPVLGTANPALPQQHPPLCSSGAPGSALSRG